MSMFSEINIWVNNYFPPQIRTKIKTAHTHVGNLEGSSLLHVACKKGDIQKCKQLVDGGCDINAIDKSEYTPFMDAIRLGIWLTIELLALKAR